jgi:hypothetical protein
MGVWSRICAGCEAILEDTVDVAEDEEFEVCSISILLNNSLLLFVNQKEKAKNDHANISSFSKWKLYYLDYEGSTHKSFWDGILYNGQPI